MKNNKLNRWLSASCAAVLAVSMLAGCGNDAKQEAPAPAATEAAAPADQEASAPAAEVSERVEGGTMYFGTSDVLGEFFTPYKQGSLTAYGWPCYEPLAKKRETREFDPCLAESWERNDDENSMTLHLVKNAVFSDGTPFTAEDVVFSLGSRAEYGTDSTIGSPSSVEALDEYTVKITWPEFSLNYEDWVLTQVMFSKKAFDENGLDWMLNNMLGTGPYKLVEFIPDVSLTYDRNENYWGAEKASPDHIKFMYMADATTMLASFMSGEIDRFMTGDPEVATQLNAAGYIPVIQTDAAEAQNIAIPLAVDENDPLYKAEVRQAIYEYGIDWDKMAVGLAGETGYHSDVIGLTGMSYYDESLEKSSFDPEKAKAMLAEAGYPDGFSTNIYTSAPFTAQATVLQQMLKDIGIEAECTFVDYSLVQSDYIGAKAATSGICITALYYPVVPQTDRFTKHVNPGATYGAACTTWSDEIKAQWDAVQGSRTTEEQDANMLTYVNSYVHDMCMYWPMYNSSTLTYENECFHGTDKAFASGTTDPLEIWTTR